MVCLWKEVINAKMGCIVGYLKKKTGCIVGA